jgi:hypothetical protein
MYIKSNAFKTFVTERCEEIIKDCTEYKNQNKKCSDIASKLEKTLSEDQKSILDDLIIESGVLESIVRMNIYIQSTIDKKSLIKEI